MSRNSVTFFIVETAIKIAPGRIGKSTKNAHVLLPTTKFKFYYQRKIYTLCNFKTPKKTSKIHLNPIKETYPQFHKPNLLSRAYSNPPFETQTQQKEANQEPYHTFGLKQIICRRSRFFCFNISVYFFGA
jgi:hypothetical protein